MYVVIVHASVVCVCVCVFVDCLILVLTSAFQQNLFWTMHVFACQIMPQGNKDRNDTLSVLKWP